MSRHEVDACDAVARLLDVLADDPEAAFVRMLQPEEQTEAREYLRGLARHTRLRKSIPMPGGRQGGHGGVTTSTANTTQGDPATPPEAAHE